MYVKTHKLSRRPYLMMNSGYVELHQVSSTSVIFTGDIRLFEGSLSHKHVETNKRVTEHNLLPLEYQSFVDNRCISLWHCYTEGKTNKCNKGHVQLEEFNQRVNQNL
jgi:hypothetical protein